MSSEQCNNCGGFEKLDVCMHCTTVVCEHCKLNHAPLCEELAKRKRRKQGPTVANTPVPQHRRGHEVPSTTGPDRHFAENPALVATDGLSTPSITMDEAVKAMEARLTAPLVMIVTPAPPTEHYKRFVDEPAPVDRGLNAVKGLLEGN